MNLVDRIRTAPASATITIRWKNDDETQSGESDFYSIEDLRTIINPNLSSDVKCGICDNSVSDCSCPPF